MATPPILLRPVGYWTVRRGDGLPDPRALMSTTWERARRTQIAGYLMTGAVLDVFDAVHACAICGAGAGRRERTDGVWRWPEGLAHDVTAHGVRLPDELVAHMARQEFTAPAVDVKALRGSLAPTNPQATSLMSQAAVAAALDDDARAPARRRRNDPLEDETAAIPVSNPWQASVMGVPTRPQKIVFDRPVVLGRDRTCDVVLEHQSVSRRHARLVPETDRVIVQDLGSSNGVWVRKKRRAGQIELKDGEQLSLGQATITIVRGR